MAALNGRSPLLAAGLVLAACQGLAAAPVTLAIRDAGGTAVPGAVVYLQGASAGAVNHPARAVVDQRDKAFVPEVTVVQTGTEISFPNSDSVSHHVYSFARPNAFELPLYKGGARPTIRFDHPGVVTLGCNIHDAMLGWIVVVETPYFTIADENGRASFADVAPGGYAAFVWSPRLDPATPESAGDLQVREGPATATLTASRRLRSAPVPTPFAGEDY